MKTERMQVPEAREQFGRVVARVRDNRVPVVLEEGGREAGAIIPMSMYRTWAELECRWEGFARAGARMPGCTEEELEDIIHAAMLDARGTRRGPGRA
ncbi:type II toxin-antitoxin system Phd/YefM family antitoxin [Longimicrobium sp.]|jgi:prevent-host-death family protein|uniref:type II toxin-antitoxin system Phd/YefM family antitoxin n=1 Tax=Longimicrobium sp. TaxID=2029185 RepID=UPI0039C9DEB8